MRAAARILLYRTLSAGYLKRDFLIRCSKHHSSSSPPPPPRLKSSSLPLSRTPPPGYIFETIALQCVPACGRRAYTYINTAVVRLLTGLRCFADICRRARPAQYIYTAGAYNIIILYAARARKGKPITFVKVHIYCILLYIRYYIPSVIL